jgi:hypothetical protein
MAGPQRQHFIPRSYLRKFATIDGDKAFVEALKKDSGKIIYPMSVADICVSRNLYTLKGDGVSDPFALEKYYATEVDSVYPDVYRILTDPAITTITEGEREKIISTCLSLYFRTPKFYDAKNEEIRALMEDAMKMNKSHTATFMILYGGATFRFARNQVEEVFQQAKEWNRTNFLISHLNDWHELVKRRSTAGIMVITIEGDLPIVAGDSPVDIYNHNNVRFDVFDPQNSITLPLNKNTYLWISPEHMDNGRLYIVRSPRDNTFARVINSTMRTNAMDWVIGEQGTLSIVIEDLKQHEELNERNLKYVDDAAQRAALLTELLAFVEAHGVLSAKSYAKMLEFKKHSLFKDDPGFKEMLRHFERKLGIS